jgi:hypothetical protein
MIMNDGPPAGLRRRRGPAGAEERIVGPPHRLAEQHEDAAGDSINANALWRWSRLYCSLSGLVALLAIIAAQSSSIGSTARGSVFFDRGTAAAIETEVIVLEDQQHCNKLLPQQEEKEPISITTDDSADKHLHHNNLPPWLRWIVPPDSQQHDKPETLEKNYFNNTDNSALATRILLLLRSCLDPGILEPSPRTLTDLIDKVITSTPRLLAIANLLLSLTFLLHTCVADWFLGGTSHASAGRERLGGFLLFKLLLISAVVGPDTLDLLILLSWYTLLSFLRSLAHLCAATTQHTIQSGQPPRAGVLQLLVAVLGSDVLSAAFCVALFHTAGWGMVLLLTCDCALLAVDVLCNILLHAGQVMEVQHADRVSRVGAQQERLLERLEQQHVRRVYVTETTVFGLQLFNHILTVGHFLHIWSLYGVQFTLIDGVLALHLHSALSSASRKISERRNLYRIARDMDGMFEDATELELRKASAAGDVCCICLGTMTMGNVKKVGCGHLYHTICLREVVERARSMEAARCPLCRASIMDGQHHSRSGAVNTINGVVVNNREVEAMAVVNTDAMAGNVETIQENVIQNRDADTATTVQTNNIINAAVPNNINPNAVQNNNNAGEHALFRFSTEGFFPRWVPLPSFSFEVVRRPTLVAQDGNNNNNNGNDNNNDNINNEPQPSFLRRLLVVAGFVPMSPEEEATALDQLVDMFPQYDRADLLRELRRRGSSEAVAESVLGGGVLALPNNWQQAEAR